MGAEQAARWHCGAGFRAIDTYHVGDERDEVAAESWMLTLNAVA